MLGLVPVIDQVIESLDRGQIEVSNRQEIREALMLLRSIALERKPEALTPPAPTVATAPAPSAGR